MRYRCILFFLLISCGMQRIKNPLLNTRWEHQVAEGCKDYINFKDTTYENYSCERNYPYSGKYEIKKDTVYLFEIDLATELPDEKRLVIKGLSKYLIAGNNLEYISWEEFEDGIWNNPIVPSNQIKFTKVY